jgi:hypothetical protein
MSSRTLHASGLTLALAAVGIASLAACSNDSSTNTLTPVATALAPTTGSDAQTGTVGQALSQAVGVHVTDQNGAAMRGAIVTWTVLAGGGSVDSTTSASDTSGNAAAHWTLGTTTGVDSLRASLANGTSVVLTATANAGAFSSLLLVSGDAQSVTAGSAAQPLVVRTVDRYGNPVAGVTVTWTVTSGDGTLDVTSSTSGADGTAQANVTTSATPGVTVVSASAGGANPVSFNVTGA